MESSNSAVNRGPWVSHEDTTIESLTLGAVVILTQTSKSRIYSLIKSGLFPQPRRLLSGGVRWARDEVVAWSKGEWTPPAAAAKAVQS